MQMQQPFAFHGVDTE